MKALGLFNHLHLPQLLTIESGKTRKLFRGKLVASTEIEIIIEYTRINITKQSELKKPALGFWGAEETAKRILDFAKNLAGGDRSKISILRDAVVQGFQQAAVILGGLPEVSQETHRLVMEGFDKWEKEGLDRWA
ncbi:MAG: hypothetical protein IBX71_01870 [Candidatus Desulforudis sp.]|nr:hypothetical protein [Desulforudis sp.]